MQEGGQWEWKSTVQRSVLKLDMLVLVNQYQTLSLAKRCKMQQMRLRSSPICCKTMQNEAKQMHSRLSPIHRKTPKMTQNAASQDSNDQKSNHENGNEKVAWKYARKRPVGVEINSSVLKSDVLVLVNLSQHCLSQNTAKRSKCA